MDRHHESILGQVEPLAKGVAGRLVIVYPGDKEIRNQLVARYKGKVEGDDLASMLENMIASHRKMFEVLMKILKKGRVFEEVTGTSYEVAPEKVLAKGRLEFHLEYGLSMKLEGEIRYTGEGGEVIRQIEVAQMPFHSPQKWIVKVRETGWEVLEEGKKEKGKGE